MNMNLIEIAVLSAVSLFVLGNIFRNRRNVAKAQDDYEDAASDAEYLGARVNQKSGS